MKKIFLCAINNILSGSCDQDCKFCAQSSKYKAPIKRYSFKNIEKVIKEAKIAYSYGARGYCLVTSGAMLDEKRTIYISKVAKYLKKEINDIKLIACAGIANKEELKELKKSGIDSYNHNLETSKNFYKNICSTHSWEDRFNTCNNIKSVGLDLCSGGIFGLGESYQDRKELFLALKELKPTSIPINFYIPNVALPIKERKLTYNEALDIINQASLLNPKILMVAGGREEIFNTPQKEKELFQMPINAIVLGDYLTTKGKDIKNDLKRIEEFGYKIVEKCQ